MVVRIRLRLCCLVLLSVVDAIRRHVQGQRTLPLRYDVASLL